MTFEVILNGTDKNSFHPAGGLSQNPFPQIAKYEYAAHILQVQKLAGDPIPDTDYIRKVLQGFSEEFVEGCCSRFRKGEIVRFTVTF